MSWRPEGWDAHKLLIEAIRTVPAREWTRERLIEVGADAMLEGLKENSLFRVPDDHTLVYPVRARIEGLGKGYLVFIPEEATDD